MRAIPYIVPLALLWTLDSAGDLYVPSQLFPVFRLARRKNPYVVHPIDTQDFLDYKTMAQNLRILSIRTDAQGHSVDWTKMREVMVQETEIDKLVFKTSQSHGRIVQVNNA